MAVGFRVNWPPWRLVHACIQVLPIPKLGTERILLVPVDVVEALGRYVALVFDNGAIRTFQVGEPRAVRRLNPVGFGFGNLGLGAARRSVRFWPHIAADVHEAAFAGGVERQQMDLFRLPVDFVTLVDIYHVPAEMPDRGLRFRRRGSADPVRQ